MILNFDTHVQNDNCSIFLLFFQNSDILDFYGVMVGQKGKTNP